MPATSLQSRIKAFESLSGPSSPPTTPSKNDSKYSKSLLETPISPAASKISAIVPFTAPHAIERSPSLSPPNLGRKISLIDLKDWVVDDGPSPTHENGFEHRINKMLAAKASHTRPLNSNGIDSKKPYAIYKSNSHSAPLISLESSPPKPPLPPRKASYTSLKSVSSAASTPASTGSPGTLQPPRRSDSLTVDHTYPPLSALNISARNGSGHAPASSISSFHSISLSSDGGSADPGTPGSINHHIATFPMDYEPSDAETMSLGESFEEVSTSSIASPTTASLALNWETALGIRRPEPPRLPQRPPPKSLKPIPPLGPSSPKPSSANMLVHPSSSASSSAPSARRKPPPPPLPMVSPPRAPSPRQFSSHHPPSRTSLTSASASDRSSINSITTNRTSISTQAAHKLSLMRPTPVPTVARRRYEKVFAANIMERKRQANKPSLLSPSMAKKTRQAAGWRGLSVDLITNPSDHPMSSTEKEKRLSPDHDEEVGPEERLDGNVIHLLWGKSKLERSRLRAIWNDCDVTNQGSLDRDSFVKGMWRIDEELRRAHIKTSSSSRANSLHPRPLNNHPNQKLILR